MSTPSKDSDYEIVNPDDVHIHVCACGKKFTWDLEQAEKVIKDSLKQSLVAEMPKPRLYDPAKSLPDHWGLTETSMERIVTNMKAAGFNEAVVEANKAINKVFNGRM